MKTILPVIVALLIVGAGTYFEGNWTERWTPHRSAKLNRFEAAIGVVRSDLKEFTDSEGETWNSVDKPIDEKTFKASGVRDSISRTYVNGDGETVDVFIAAGHSRHITIHTPEWCYPGAGFKSEGDPNSMTIEAEGLKSNPEFLTKVYAKPDPTNPFNVRILWTYTEDGHWRGPRMPKPAYGNRPALFKIYLITQLSESNPSGDEERLNEFAKDFMPQVTDLLFAERIPAADGKSGVATDPDHEQAHNEAAESTQAARG